jgi:hypothetical protein
MSVVVPICEASVRARAAPVRTDAWAAGGRWPALIDDEALGVLQEQGLGGLESLLVARGGDLLGRGGPT